MNIAYPRKTCSEDRIELLRGLRLAVFDFDGVFTDNAVWISEQNVEMVRCCRSDGLGLRRLSEVGVDALIVSTEVNPVVSVRAEKLRIDCEQGVEEKGEFLNALRGARGLRWEEIAFVGNDINDRACLERVGLPVVVADAWEEVKPLAKWTLSRRGGEGAVREFCDAVWKARRNG